MNREPVFAGKFYPAEKEELMHDLENYFSNAVPRQGDAIAVISPHAGYVFSGGVAASAYNQINPDLEYENVFVLTSSHSAHFKGVSVYKDGNYITPLGEIQLNEKIAEELIRDNILCRFIPEAHSQEHSLEVQLPFLQYHLKYNFKLIPIVIGQGENVSAELAHALKPYYNRKNLFIISSDFSHYPEYKDAIRVDEKTAISICKNSVSEFLKTRLENKKIGIGNLSTDICGASSVLTLLNLTENKNFNYKIIDYKNSGDAIFGDKHSVVGYSAIAVFENKINEFDLSNNEKKYLLNIARESIEKSIDHKSIEIDTSGLSKSLNSECGVFVTLKKDGRLRGCIGSFTSNKPLPMTVSNLAVSSAFNDYRFSAVSKKELKKIKIEISVLTPMKKIQNINEIELGKHGIYIKKEGKSGTFLPDVATDTGWSLIEFIERCAVDKAGLKPGAWKDADIYIYETIKFSE